MFDPIFTYSRVTSTMEVAVELAQLHRPPYGVQALKQTKGYGRQGRMWHSEGENLYLTLVLNPSIPTARRFELSFISAIAIHQTIKALIPFDDQLALTLKWPNDVLVKGKKIAGILLETHSFLPDYVFVGIGLNVKEAPPGAVSLNESGFKGEDKQVLEKLLLSYEMIYTLWQKQGFSTIMDMWRKRGPVKGSPISFHSKNTLYEGIFDYVDDQGVLHLITPQGALAFRSGDVL